MCRIIFLLAMVAALTARAQDSTRVLNATLPEIEIRSTPPLQFDNRVRSGNVYFSFDPSRQLPEGIKRQNIFFLTKMERLSNDAVRLHAAELRLKPFDTSLFELQLMIFQVQGSDTIYHIIPVPAWHIEKGRLKVNLFEAFVTITPGIFYMGYGIKYKELSRPYHYKVYATDKGEGAILTFYNGDIIFSPAGNSTPLVFPFRLWYR